MPDTFYKLVTVGMISFCLSALGSSMPAQADPAQRIPVVHRGAGIDIRVALNDQISKTQVLTHFQGSEDVIMKDRNKCIGLSQQIPDKIFIPRKTRSQDRIIVISSRNGVGKSFVSLNLAQTYAGNGHRVLLIKPDTVSGEQEGNVYPKKNAFRLINTLMSEDRPETPESSPEGNLDIITIRQPDIKTEFGVVDTDPDPFLSCWSGYEYIIIDTQTGLSEFTLSMLSKVNKCLLVSTPDASSIFETYSLIKASFHYLSKPDIYLVLNQVVDGKMSREAHQNLNFALNQFLDSKISLLAMIPSR